MAKQTFTTGSVLTAAQMNNLQANDYNWSVDSKSASYVLVASDAGKRIEMNAAGSTTITVNTGLFTAGDMVYISNIGAGTCTVTAGTATVNKSTNASLALAQYQSGMLYFVSASSAIFYPFDIGSAAAGAYTLISTTTLSGATTTISGLSGYNKLELIVVGAGQAASSAIGFNINSTGASMDGMGTRIDGSGATQAFYGATGWSNLATPINSTSTSNVFYISIDDANLAHAHTGLFYGYYVGTYGAFVNVAYRTASTAAVSSVIFSSLSSSFNAGTVYAYGVK